MRSQEGLSVEDGVRYEGAQLEAERLFTAGVTEPTLYFDGQPPNPDHIRVLLPAELATDYHDVTIERIIVSSPAFREHGYAYLREMLDPRTIQRNDFTWPKFKLPDEHASKPDDELFNPDGSPQSWLLDYVFNYYLIPTVAEKGNIFMAMHGTVNGIPGSFIGGGLAFPSPANEDEEWVSGGIVAETTNGICNRGKGLGRLILEARIANLMLTNTDDNLNTGVNINPEGVPRIDHETTIQLFQLMDVMRLLKEDDPEREPITADSLIAEYAQTRDMLAARGYSQKLLERANVEKLHAAFAHALEGVDMHGATPATMNARKEILRAVAGAHGSYLTATERIFLTLGGQYLNAIESSARTRNGPNWHTRRLILYRDTWTTVAAQRHPELAAILAVTEE